MDEMPFSTRIKIAAAIGGVILIILLIVMIVFVNRNSGDSSAEADSGEETEIVDEENSISDDMVSFAVMSDTDSKTLVGLTEDLGIYKLTNLSNITDQNFVTYDYSDDTIYLLYEDSDFFDVYTLDIETGALALIMDRENDYQSSFQYCDGYIYYIGKGSVQYKDDVYSTVTDNYIYRYNLETYDYETFISSGGDTSEIVSMQIDKNKNVLYFMLNSYTGQTSTCETRVGIVDMETGDVSDIIQAEAEGQEILLNGDHLAIKLRIGNTSAHYLYDSNSTTVWNLKSLDLNYEDLDSYVAFSDECIAFSDGEKITLYDYDGNIVDESVNFAEADSRIYDIAMIKQDLLEIRICDNDNVSASSITYAFLLDLTDSTTNEITETYSDVKLIIYE